MTNNGTDPRGAITVVSSLNVVAGGYLLRPDGSIEGRNVWSVTPRYGFKAPKRAWRGELSRQKWRGTRTPGFPSQRKLVLEVIRRRLE